MGSKMFDEFETRGEFVEKFSIGELGRAEKIVSTSKVTDIVSCGRSKRL